MFSIYEQCTPDLLGSRAVGPSTRCAACERWFRSWQHFHRDVGKGRQAMIVGEETVATGLDGSRQMQRIAQFEVVCGPDQSRPVKYAGRNRYDLHVGACEKRIVKSEPSR